MNQTNPIIKVYKDLVSDNVIRYNYYAAEDFKNCSQTNTVVECFDITERVHECLSAREIEQSIPDNKIMTSTFNPGGWQSWSPGYPLFFKERQPSLKNRIVPQWNCYLTVPGTAKKDFKKEKLLSQFIFYSKCDGYFFMIASTGNVTDRNPIKIKAKTGLKLTKNNVLPPVQYVVDRENTNFKITIADVNKVWHKNEVMCQICFITAESFMQTKSTIEKLYGSSDIKNKNYSHRFDSTLHLGKTPQGWESWYNHYADINEALILDDLESLGSTENIISLNRKTENSVREKKDSRPASDKKNTSSKADKKNTDAENSPCVFQIDDGWEKALGDWEWNLSRFPSGGKKMASTIKSKGYIPGLWLAPFIIDLRSDTARRHPEWILCDEKGKPVSAGYNPLWGANFGKDQPGFPGTFYCLDLSNEDVLTHLDKLMDTVINKWGFEYLKLDFLYAGMLNGNFVNEGAAYEHYDKAVKILTKRKASDDGAKICYLGCGAPFEASFNDFPLCRIGCDTLEHWEDKRSVKMNWNGRTSCYLNMQDSIGRNIWNRTIFLNDPDVIFIRKNNCSLTDSEKKLVAIGAFLFGSQLMYSDDPASSSSPEEVKLAKEILAIKDELKNIQPCATLIEKRAYLITDEAESKESAKKKFILNLSDKTLSFEGLSVPAHSAANLEKKIIY